jgi:hypothetical protein
MTNTRHAWQQDGLEPLRVVVQGLPSQVIEGIYLSHMDQLGLLSHLPTLSDGR